MTIPTALTIAGSDSGGGAGIQADLKTFLACQVHGMSAITAVTVQNSLGVSGFYELPPNAVAEQIESVVTDIGVGAAKTGMLARRRSSPRSPRRVARLDVRAAGCRSGRRLAARRRPAAPGRPRGAAVADPAAGHAGHPEPGRGAAADRDHGHRRRSAREAAIALHELGPSTVLVKGGHLPSGDAVDLLYDGTSSSS